MKSSTPLSLHRTSSNNFQAFPPLRSSSAKYAYVHSFQADYITSYVLKLISIMLFAEIIILQLNKIAHPMWI